MIKKRNGREAGVIPNPLTSGITCTFCGKPGEYHGRFNVCNSQDCITAFNKVSSALYDAQYRPCPMCGKEITVDLDNPNPKIYCSKSCKNKAYRVRAGQKNENPGRPAEDKEPVRFKSNTLSLRFKGDYQIAFQWCSDEFERRWGVQWEWKNDHIEQVGYGYVLLPSGDYGAFETRQKMYDALAEYVCIGKRRYTSERLQSMFGPNITEMMNFCGELYRAKWGRRWRFDGETAIWDKGTYKIASTEEIMGKGHEPRRLFIKLIAKGS